MNESPFRRSRFWGWLSVVTFVALPLLFVWPILGPHLRSGDGDVPLLSILVCAAALLTFGFLSYLLAVQLLTDYGTEGIRQPALLGARFLAWQEVREVRDLTDVGLDLVGDEVVIHINFAVFEDRQGLVEGIRARIPVSAYPDAGRRRQEDHLRQQRVVLFLAAVNLWCAVLILGSGRSPVTIALAAVFLVLALLSAWRWIRLRNSRP